jgi:polyhydroxyalkanoate synthesis regulator phasin
MKEKLKELMLFGLGSAVLAKEIVEDFVDDMVQSGKAQSEDKARLMEELSEKMKDQRDQWEGKIKDSWEKILEELNFATTHDLEEMKEQLTNEKEELLSEMNSLKEEMAALKNELAALKPE